MNPFIGGRALALSFCLVSAAAVQAEEPAVIEVTLKDHRFVPAEVRVKTGKPTILSVTNLDPQPEEFEMLQLAIEKVIPPGGKGRIRIRPLGPGRYAFIGEFHKDTAQGTIISE
jgi:hypothetical protein